MTKKLKIKPAKGKRFSPHTSEKKSPEQQEPTFSLTYLEASKKYCLSYCNKNEKAALADTLHKLSKLTWTEIKNSSYKGLGFEKIREKTIKAPIPTYIKDDVNFIAFRFFGKASMVGYRKKRTFYIIWIDRNFSLYDHG